jgi:hypothetical protein
MNSFRLTWDKIADHVLTSPHRRVTWYEGDARHLRLTADPATGHVWLYVALPHSWRLVDEHDWPIVLPAKLAHLARAALIAERDVRFPYREVEPAEAVMRCRPPRLRTVRR